MAKIFRVQKKVADKPRTAAGQKIANIGEVWVTIATSKNRAIAERAWRNAQVDNPDRQIRMEPK